MQAKLFIAGLRLLEEDENRIQILKSAIKDGFR